MMTIVYIIELAKLRGPEHCGARSRIAQSDSTGSGAMGAMRVG